MPYICPAVFFYIQYVFCYRRMFCTIVSPRDYCRVIRVVIPCDVHRSCASNRKISMDIVHLECVCEICNLYETIYHSVVLVSRGFSRKNIAMSSVTPCRIKSTPASSHANIRRIRLPCFREEY